MAGLLDILSPVLGPIIERVFPDPVERQKYELQLATLADAEAQRQSNERIAQTEVNKVEAGSSVLFVAGWRPFIGWSCAGALIYSTIFAPMFHLGIPNLDFLQVVLLGMLGISVGARSLEKVKGVAQNSLAGPQPVGEPNASIIQQVPVKKKKPLGGLWPF
jgi:hypothetical protein